MTNTEIEDYLSQKNIQLRNEVSEEIETFRQSAICNQDEKAANYYWCLLQIYKIQKEFLSAINALKNQKYENAWCALDHTDIELGLLEENFDITQENDKFHLVFICKMIKEYQKLFPYYHFMSRECVIKAEECSICGKPVSLRHPCAHKLGKLYMGEVCLRKVTEMEFKAFSIVTDPFDKYAYLQIQGQEYNYGILEAIMTEINQPYDAFFVETIKVQKPEYKGIECNDLCPCGSGKKYKKCHLGSTEELMDHHIVHFEKPMTHENKFLGIFGTWK